MAVLPGKQRELPNLRRIVHCTAAALLHYSGCLSFCSWFQRRVLKRREVMVVGLHRVLTEAQCAASLSEPAMIMLVSTFESMLEMLRKTYRVIGMDDLHSLADTDGSRPLCMITFDDAWSDTFENAYPALRTRSLPSTVFVPTGLVGTQKTFWVERLTRAWNDNAELTRQLAQELSAMVRGEAVQSLRDAIAALKTVSAAERESFITSAESRLKISDGRNDIDTFMSWDELKKCSEGMTIASHTVTHVLLTCEEPTVVDRELVDSKRELESRVGQQVTAFAYPSGAYNDTVRNAVEKAGYTFAFTTVRARYRAGGDPLSIPRVLLHEGSVTGLTGRFSPAMFHLRLMGWH